jgi:hypothetical protein
MPENICLFMQSCLTFGNSRILAETLVVVGHEGKVEKEEDEEAEEEEEEDEGKVQVNACIQHLQNTLLYRRSLKGSPVLSWDAQRLHSCISSYEECVSIK